MAGVFDSLMSDDPKEQAYMALAAGLLSGRGNFNKVAGEALMGSQNVYRQAQEAKTRQQQQVLQQQMLQAQLAEMQRKEKMAEEQPLRMREALALFPMTQVVQGPPDESGAYPMRKPGEQDYMNWALNAYALDPGLSSFGWKAAEGISSREDKQTAAKEAQAAAIQAQKERAAADAAARLERDKQHMQMLAAIRASAPRNEPAPTLTTIADPTDETGKRQIVVDARVYRGGGTGAAGVLGASGKEAGTPLKAIPPTVNTAIIENKMGQSRIDRAITLLEGKDIGDPKKGGRVGDKAATGWKGFLPDPILTRVDPSGVDARAEVADIGSLKIHDRSGAAVTISEAPRLMPFIPKATDDNSTVLKKLRRLKTEMQQAGMALAETYSEDQGYRPSPISVDQDKSDDLGGGFRLKK